jgi:hypothetical protein
MFDSERSIGRRAVLIGAGVAASLTALPGAEATDRKRLGDRTAEQRAVRDRILAGRSSDNGWPIEKGVGIGGSIWPWPIEGCDATWDGSISILVVMSHVVRRFHYEVETVESGDLAGYIEPRDQMLGFESNHASGTAVDIKPASFPTGARNGFYKHQKAAILDIVRECGGVVAWGGQMSPVCESHFQIDVGPNDVRLSALVARLLRREETPSVGAGVW